MTIKGDVEDFERSIKRELESFLNPQKPKPKRPDSAHVKSGFIVKLAVRRKRIDMETIFEHESKSISQLEATIEAEKAARKAGYSIIGHTHSIEPR